MGHLFNCVLIPSAIEHSIPYDSIPKLPLLFTFVFPH